MTRTIDTPASEPEITAMNVPALPNLLTTAAVGSIRDAFAATSTSPVPTAPSLTDVRLPKLTLTVTARRVRGVPATMRAGRYLLTVIGDPPSPTSPGGVMLIQLPAGMTLDEAMAEAERATDAPPAFFGRSIMPGGAEIREDGLSRTVIDLVPGEWIVAGYAMSTAPTTMTVTGAMPAMLPQPPANATVTIDERGIAVEGSLRPGRNVVRIDNAGRLPRFVDIERAPGRFGRGGLVASSADQSGGTSMWLPLTLDPGTYVLRDGMTGARTGRLAVA
jgi:hypothetical protein